MKNVSLRNQTNIPGSYLLKIAVLILFIVFPASIGIAFASDKTSEPEVKYKSVINILPAYLSVNGMRLDYDIALTRNHWIQAGPVLFLAENKTGRYLAGDKYLQHFGAGLHLYHRYYPGQGFQNTPVYISYGGMWHYNHLEYNKESSGIESDRYSAIQKVGADVIIGFCWVAADRLLIDFYTGMGVRYSTLTTDAPEPSRFNDGYFAPGYSGNVLLLGVRIGFLMSPASN
jgi:hypothetical protein